MEHTPSAATTTTRVTVDGTKLKLSKAMVDRVDKMRKNALKMRFPKALVNKYRPPVAAGMLCTF